MLDDYTMVVTRFDDEIDIIPIGDVHLGAIEHDEPAWQSFLNAMKDEPNTKLILLGDLLNNVTRNSVGSPYDEVYRPMEAKRMMAEYLEPIKDRILCAVSGNHERRSKSGKGGVDQDLTYDIMCRLGIEDRYRENECFLKVGIGARRDNRYDKSKDRINASYIFVITHGAAGGRLTGNPINRGEEMSRVYAGDFDCFIVGHSHKGAVTRPSRIIIDAHNEKVSVKSYLMVSAESWMIYGGYAAQKMLLPAEHGKPQRLHLSRSRDFKRIDVTW